MLDESTKRCIAVRDCVTDHAPAATPGDGDLAESPARVTTDVCGRQPRTALCVVNNGEHTHAAASGAQDPVTLRHACRASRLGLDDLPQPVACHFAKLSPVHGFVGSASVRSLRACQGSPGEPMAGLPLPCFLPAGSASRGLPLQAPGHPQPGTDQPTPAGGTESHGTPGRCETSVYHA